MVQYHLGPRIAALYELQAELLEPKLRALGVSWSAFQLLAAVHASGGKASQAEISRKLGVTPATLSEAIHVQIEKGLFRQEASKGDKRVKLVKLTPKAVTLMRKIQVHVDSIESSLTAGIKKMDLKLLAQLLDQAGRNLEKLLQKP